MVTICDKVLFENPQGFKRYSTLNLDKIFKVEVYLICKLRLIDSCQSTENFCAANQNKERLFGYNMCEFEVILRLFSVSTVF